jgi:hypothetical protein
MEILMLMEASCPLQEDHCQICYLVHHAMHEEIFFQL